MHETSRTLANPEETPQGSPAMTDTSVSADAAEGEGARALQPGDRMGHYELRNELGRGGMGVVYAAFDTKLEREVAIKRLQRSDDPTHRERLVREALAMAKLSHPNVITVYEIGEDGEATFIVMELVEGVTLREWLETPRAWTELLAVFEAAARGLSAAHQKHLVHRDFKPDNVMIGVDERVRVMDFGLARANAATPADEPLDNEEFAELDTFEELEELDWEKLTQSGSMLGTPAYMSPEQLCSKPAGPASDQFSFCIALYEALYGARPFDGETLPQLCSSVVAGELQDPPADADVPAWLRALVTRGLRTQPRQRFASMRGLLDALQEGLSSSRAREPPAYAFVAHDSRDKQAVLRLCEALLEQGVRPWLDMWELPPETDGQTSLEAALAEAPAVIVCSQPRYTKALTARRVREPETVYAVRLPDARAAHARRADVDFEAQGWDEGVRALAQLVGVDALRHDWLEREAQRAGIEARAVSPYRGLKAFHERDARWMFGREEEVEELLELIRAGQARFLTLIGASGSGKSSLLLGGVCPQLRVGVLGDGVPWSIVYLRPGPRPCEALARALVGLEPDMDAVERRRAVERSRSALLERADALSSLVRERERDNLLLALDQLEELFTEAGLGAARGGGEAMAFVRNLLEATRAAAEERGRLWIVATLRADFVQRGLEVSELARAIKGGTYCALPPMHERQIRAAIERPAARVGYRVEAKLVDKLVSAAAHQPGRLPLLQHVLQQLWLRRYETRRLLTLAAYTETGGLEGAITDAAERALERIRAELGDEGTLIARRLMTRLVHLGSRSSEDTRRRIALAQLGDDARTLRVLDVFVTQARVLVAAQLDGVEAVELAHEALLREWSTLIDWLDADREALKLRQELAEDAHKRASARADDYLWAAGRVEEARRVLASSLVELNGAEREFLAASEASARRWRGLVRGSVGALLVTAALIVAVVSQQNAALAAKNKVIAREKARAEREQARAEREQLRASAELFKQMGWRASMLARSPGNELAALALAIEGTEAADANTQQLPGPVFSGLVSAAMSVDAGLPLRGHGDKLSAVAYSPDGSTLATASLDATVRVWDAKSGGLLQILEHADKMYAVAFSPDGSSLAAACADETVRVWAASSGELRRTLELEDVARGVAFSPDGAHVTTAERGGRVRVWDVDTAEVTLTLAHAGPVEAVAWSPDGARLVSVSLAGQARVWAANDGAALASFAGHGRGKLHAVAWSPDGAQVATGGEDDTARLWDAVTGAQLAVLEHHAGVRALAFSPDGEHLISGTFDDDAAHLWELESAGLVRSLRHAGPVMGVGWSPDGAAVATASWDQTGRLWTVGASPAMRKLEGHAQGVYAVAASPDGSRFATGSGDDTARLWDASTGAAIATLRGHAHDLSAVSFSPDGELLATAAWDGTARLWDGREGSFIRTLEDHEGRVHGLSFSPDGAHMATASADKRARIWELETGAVLHTLAHDSGVIDLSFSPDGQRLLSLTAVGTGHLWSAVTGEALEFDFAGAVRAGAFSPDGELLALATKGNVVVLWSPATGEVRRLEGHAAPINVMRFSSEGELLMTGSEDGVARLWRVAGGQELAALVHAGAVVDVAFSADGTRALSASGDAVARVWSLAPGPWLGWGCAMLSWHDAQSSTTRQVCASAPRVDFSVGAARTEPQLVDGDAPRYELLTERGVEFVRIPAGSFVMGSPAGVGSDAERPQHEVSVDSFYLARTELTNAQYATYLEANADVEPPQSWSEQYVDRYGAPNNPVVGLSWYDAKAYCDWAGFQLPTEAQWEYAARAGTTTDYWYGDELDELQRFGWFMGNSGDRPRPVGCKGANSFGLFDMAGGVYEWTLDAYGSYASAARAGDGARHEPIGDADRILRGGSWDDAGRLARSGYRGSFRPNARFPGVGVRPCKNVP